MKKRLMIIIARSWLKFIKLANRVFILAGSGELLDSQIKDIEQDLAEIEKETKK